MGAQRPTRRTLTEPIPVEEEGVSSAARAEAEGLLSAPYGKKAIEDYMRQRFGSGAVLYSKDMALEDDHSYVMSLLAVLNAGDRGSFYKVEQLDGTYTQGNYSIPQFKLTKKEGK